MKRPGPPGYEHRKEPPGHQKFTSVVPDYGPILVFGKVVQVDPLTADRCGKTVAFVKVGDTDVNENCSGKDWRECSVGTCDRPICEQWDSKL